MVVDHGSIAIPFQVEAELPDKWHCNSSRILPLAMRLIEELEGFTRSPLCRLYE
jgi:hypothetical protein